MKQYVVLGLVLAFVVDISLFAGVGFATGALAASQPLPGSGANYQQSNYSIDSPSNGLTFSTSFAGCLAGQCVNPYITSPEAGQPSTTLTFQLNINVGPACASSSNPAYESGKQNGAYDAYYAISFSPNPGAVTGSIDSVPFTTTTGQTFASNNGSTVVWAYCQQLTGNNYAYAPPGYQFQHALVLDGNYPTMTVTVSFFVQGQFCYGKIGTQHGVCGDLSSQLGEPLYAPSGGFDGWASASATFYSAGASLQLTGQPYTNGGTVTAVLTTGYDDGGYRIGVYCPLARSCAGSVDTSFTPESVCGSPPQVVAGLLKVPDNEQGSGCAVTWKIPANAAVNNSAGAPYNQWLVELTTSYVQGLWQQFAVINPAYAPGQPSISYADAQGRVSPMVGDTLTLSFAASPHNESGSVSAIYIQVYYLAPSVPATQPPSCPSSAFVTSPCAGMPLTAITFSSGSATGSYSFTVDPPTGSTFAVGVAAYSGTSSGQSSATSYDLINICAANCGSTQTLDFWSWLGPITLLLAPMLLLAIPAVVVEAPAVRFGALAAIVAIAVVGGLLFHDLQAAFVAGGALGGRG